MSTPKKNGNGAKEVTPATNNAANGKTNTTATANPKADEKPKTEDKAAPVAAETTNIKAPTIEERLQYHEGMDKLVKRRRILGRHLEAIGKLNLEDNDLEYFENPEGKWAKIILVDKDENEYIIDIPALVRELQLDLMKRLETKLNQFDGKILTYGQSAT